LSASFVSVHDKPEVCPHAMVEGLKEAVQIAWGTTVTVAVHVFVPPVPLSTLNVHVCVDVGEAETEPLAPDNVPLPRLPVQL